MKLRTSILLLLLPVSVFAQAVLGVKYSIVPYANIHQNPSRYSNVLATISCNHPIQHLAEEKATNQIPENVIERWLKIKTGEYVGYIQELYVADKKINCIQDSYPKFFDELNLGLTDMYYWARLYDMYLIDKSQVK